MRFELGQLDSKCTTFALKCAVRRMNATGGGRMRQAAASGGSLFSVLRRVSSCRNLFLRKSLWIANLSLPVPSVIRGRLFGHSEACVKRLLLKSTCFGQRRQNENEREKMRGCVIYSQSRLVRAL